MVNRLHREQLDSFHRKGYLLVGPLISPTTLQELKSAFQQMVQSWAEECDTSVERYLKVISQWTNVWKQHPAFQRQLHHQQIAAIARQLVGSSRLQLFHDHLIYKPPADGGKLRSGTIPWHQDYPYWPINRPRAVSCWLALDHASTESGAMAFMPGAHLDGEAPPVDFLHTPKDWGTLSEQAESIEVPAGWGIFHDCLSWHMSPPNQSANPRLAYITIMLDAECRWDPAHSDWHPMNTFVSVSPGERLNEDAFPII